MRRSDRFESPLTDPTAQPGTLPIDALPETQRTEGTENDEPVRPVDRPQLEGVARIMGYPAGGASRLEEDYLRTTRLARTVFERGFYGTP